MAQPFNQKIGDTKIDEDGQIDLWIKIVLMDEKSSEGVEVDSQQVTRFMHLNDSTWELKQRSHITQGERLKKTLARAEDVIKNQIWSSISSTFFEEKNS